MNLQVGPAGRRSSIIRMGFVGEDEAMLRRILLAPLVLGLAAMTVAGCSSRADSPPPVAQEEILTPERAKAALLDMMRSKSGKDLGWFDGDTPDKMAELPIETGEDGWY